MSHSIYFNFIIKSDIGSVYKAVSEPKLLEKWWPLKCSGIPKKGQEYNFNFTDEYDWYAKVTSCELDDHIHFKMTKSDNDWDPTTFGFKLKKKENGTCLNFFHKDWPECNNHFKHSSFCWAMLLNGLKDYLENGVVIPFENRS